MELEFPRSISDGYPEYVDDELGYHYHAWEVISASESTRHERIRLAEADELDALEDQYSPLSDLERWALARHHLKLGHRQKYFSLLEPILAGSAEHRALHYPEIFADVARRHAEDQNLDAAREVVAKIVQTWPELEPAIPLLDAKLLMRAQRFDEADQAYREEFEKEELAADEAAEIYFEAAVDFFETGATDLARKWLDQARQAAEESNDTAITVDIELLADQFPDEPDGQTNSENPE